MRIIAIPVGGPQLPGFQAELPSGAVRRSTGDDFVQHPHNVAALDVDQRLVEQRLLLALDSFQPLFFGFAYDWMKRGIVSPKVGHEVS